MWPELYINSKLVSLVASVRQLAVATPSLPPSLNHLDGRHPKPAPVSLPPPASVKPPWLSIHAAGGNCWSFQSLTCRILWTGGARRRRQGVRWQEGVGTRAKYSSTWVPTSTHIHPTATHHTSSITYTPRPSFYWLHFNFTRIRREIFSWPIT